MEGTRQLANPVDYKGGVINLDRVLDLGPIYDIDINWAEEKLYNKFSKKRINL